MTPKKRTPLISVDPNKTIEMECYEAGTHDGCEVTAATDAAGPQVIVKGENVHLLSRPLKDHKSACSLADKVVKEGPSCHKDWYDLKKGGIGLNLIATMGGEFRDVLGTS